MASYDTAEVEKAFQHYWKTGAVDEDWDGFADNFTDDAHYIEHFFGAMRGRETIREWIKPIMDQFGELYTAYEWHMCGADGRVVVYMQNRRDNPDPSGPPIDFPGVTILQYAGDGKWSLEEDYWALKAAQQAGEQYKKACERFDADHPKKRTRLHWGDGPAWTRGAASYGESAGARRAGG